MERQPARSFQDLIVWQKAHQFVLATYRLTADLGYGNTKSLMSASDNYFRSGSCWSRTVGRFCEAAILLRKLPTRRVGLQPSANRLVVSRDPLMPKLEEVSKLLESYASAILDSDS